jgi:two-component system chemotaxis response regulator CheY
MKTVIVEDDYTSRLILLKLMKSYGPSHIAVNGAEAVEAVRTALETGAPYNLICLDIMMPEMNGHEALREIRLMEETKGVTGSDRVKIIMTTALADKDNVIKAHAQQCDAFLVKPVHHGKLLEVLAMLNLIS